MDDRTLVNQGMAYAQQTMETGDDLIQALLAALSERSILQQRSTLEQFSQYEKTGGKLKAIQFDINHLEDFRMMAREEKFMHYAIRDRRTEQALVIFRECDRMQMNLVVERMAEEGKPLYQNPQLSVFDFLEKNEEQEIMFCPIESMEQVEAAKWAAAKRKVEFAVGKQQDGSYIVIFCKADMEVLQELGIIDQSKSACNLFQTSDMEKVKKIVRDERKAEDAVKESEQENKKHHER